MVLRCPDLKIRPIFFFFFFTFMAIVATLKMFMFRNIHFEKYARLSGTYNLFNADAIGMLFWGGG